MVYDMFDGLIENELLEDYYFSIFPLQHFPAPLLIVSYMTASETIAVSREPQLILGGIVLSNPYIDSSERDGTNHFTCQSV